MKDLIIKRKEMKSRKPKFVRQDAHKKKRVGRSWRRPKGIQSKVRLCIKGYRKSANIGYGAPKQAKGLSKEGLERVYVSNVSSIDSIDNKKQGIIISSSVGKRKKLAIIKAAKEKQVTILNLKDPAKYMGKIEDEMKKKKEDKQKKKKAKEEKKKEKLETKVEEKKEEQDKQAETPEDKIKREKKEKDKLLISKSEG